MKAENMQHSCCLINHIMNDDLTGSTVHSITTCHKWSTNITLHELFTSANFVSSHASVKQANILNEDCLSVVLHCTVWFIAKCLATQWKADFWLFDHLKYRFAVRKASSSKLSQWTCFMGKAEDNKRSLCFTQTAPNGNCSCGGGNDNFLGQMLTETKKILPDHVVRKLFRRCIS